MSDDNYKSLKEKLTKEWHGSVRSAGILPAVSLSSLSRVDGGSHDILKNVKFYDRPFIGGTRSGEERPGNFADIPSVWLSLIDSWGSIHEKRTSR